MKKETIVSSDDSSLTVDLSRKDIKAVGGAGEEERKNNNGNHNANNANSVKEDELVEKTVEKSVEKNAEAYTVAVSVHDEKVADSNSSSKSAVNILEVLSAKEKQSEREHGDTSPANVTKSTSSETQTSLGTSTAFYTETTILGASTSSLTSISSSTTVPYRPGPTRHRRIAGYIDENDLSTPYNHYRCLSPNEHYGKSLLFLLPFLRFIDLDIPIL